MSERCGLVLEWSVTGVGGMPWDREASWAEVARVAPATPFVPEPVGSTVFTPFRDWLRLGADTAGFRYPLADDPVDTQHSATSGSSFDLFQIPDNFASLLPAARVLKSQILGPVTAGAHLTWNEVPIASMPERRRSFLERYRSALVSGLHRCPPVELHRVLVFDEPSLGAEREGEPPAAVETLEAAVAAVRGAGLSAGIHCCRETWDGVWPVVDRVVPDVISLPVTALLSELGSSRLRAFIERGGCVILGVANPAAPAPTAEQTQRAVARVAALLRSIELPQALVRRAVGFSPDCGVGLLAPADATLLFDTVHAMSRRIAESFL